MSRPPWWRIGLATVFVIGLGLVLHSVGVSWRSYIEVFVQGLLLLLFDLFVRARERRGEQLRPRNTPPPKTRR